MAVYRVYAEKKRPFAMEAMHLLADIREVLGMRSVENIRILNRYDVSDISEEDFISAKTTVFSEPQVDFVYDKLPETDGRIFAVQYLAGQFDQRADSAEQCISIMTQKERPKVMTAKVYIIEGAVDEGELAAIKKHLINPVESKEAELALPETLDIDYAMSGDVETITGFISFDEEQLAEFLHDRGLAMDLEDVKFCAAYFRNQEKRDPTLTEIRMIDTYWSDHCRHTTFSTQIEEVSLNKALEEAFKKYLDARREVYGAKAESRPKTLMDLATIGAKTLKRRGMIPDLDESEEINACSVKVDAVIDGRTEPWIFMFKNETHNHPTEIEPFGGAATCLGGAIRDPLSGRSYVYQAMRVTGSADPTVPASQTMKGKLPQRKITTSAAAGYSSYGNQIGLATGHVSEVYHPGYAAKRLEIGAVLGAAPAENIVRESPAPGDLIILLGGRTGRDGCGGATGSSKSHTLESLATCGAEVQKGNPPEERKLQRLFRDPKVTHMIKRCNDFGAGGVSVAVGELADGLSIDLDRVPKKYDGLDGTELAISESQERMAVVVRACDAEKFLEMANSENLEATVIAVVTQEPRLEMTWRGKTIVSVSREFLNSNGAPKYTDVACLDFAPLYDKNSDNMCEFTAEKLEKHLSSLNIASQKGLVERFDSTIGAGTVLSPFGGKTRLSPAQSMASLLPALEGVSKTATLMSWGFDPYLMEKNQYAGAVSSVCESICRLVAAGGSRKKCWLTFQEYFERTKNDPKRWGKPFASLLGALTAQLELGVGSIGGKDSMSGTFESLDVPPTLVSFAAGIASVDNVISPEFKKAGNKVYYIAPKIDENGVIDIASLNVILDMTEKLISEKKAVSVWSVSAGGIAEGVFKMAVGNGFGFEFAALPTELEMYSHVTGLIIEAADELPLRLLGTVTNEADISCGNTSVAMGKLTAAWENTLSSVFPYFADDDVKAKPEKITYRSEIKIAPAVKTARPKTAIAVFPGTNCEYDTARALNTAGADAEILVVNTLSPSKIEESIVAFEKLIRKSNMIVLPGGFSGGDEPEGSGKFITAFFRNPRIVEAVRDLLKHRDGLMLGICNGFQALIKLGLVPYGDIIETDDACPTLTFNTIGRHQSTLARTRVCSNRSPWLCLSDVDDIHTVAMSHGEGRFVCEPELLNKLIANGQVAFQYVDDRGEPTMDLRHNPNGSVMAIEGITSPDGRVLGKMGHSERWQPGVYKNIKGPFDQKIFASAVKYFSL